MESPRQSGREFRHWSHLRLGVIGLAVFLTTSIGYVAQSAEDAGSTEPTLAQRRNEGSGGRQSSISGPPGPSSSGQVSSSGVVPADLQVTKTDTPDPVVAGQNLTYTLSVKNLGPNTAPTVQALDLVPQGTTFAGFVGISQGNGGELDGLITANFGTILSGVTATLTIVVNVDPNLPDGSTILNSASATSPAFDPNTANNSVTTSTTVIGADLRVTKSHTPPSVTPGNNLSYTITVSNGPVPASNVVVLDTVPANTTFVATSSAAGWSVTAPPVGGQGSVIFTNPALAAGVTATLTIYVNVSPDAPPGHVITNQVVVRSQSFDSDQANNVYLDTTIVGPTTPTTTPTATSTPTLTPSITPTRTSTPVLDRTTATRIPGP